MLRRFFWRWFTGVNPVSTLKLAFSYRFEAETACLSCFKLSSIHGWGTKSFSSCFLSRGFKLVFLAAIALGFLYPFIIFTIFQAFKSFKFGKMTFPSCSSHIVWLADRLREECSDTGHDCPCFLSWRPLLPKFQTFPRRLFFVCFVTGDNTRTDLRTGILPSVVSSKRFFTRSWLGNFTLYRSCTVIQDFKSCEHKYFERHLSHFPNSIPTFWQISAKTSPLQSLFLDGLRRFFVST